MDRFAELPDIPRLKQPVPFQSSISTGEELEPGEIPIQTINNYRQTARKLGPGTTVMIPDRTLRITQYRGRTTTIEHIEPIYTETCSKEGNNKQLNPYGKKLLRRYKSSCDDAPWNYNPCVETENIDLLAQQAENYYLCGCQRRRFSNVCVIKGDNEHTHAIKKQDIESDLCQNKILQTQRYEKRGRSMRRRRMRHRSSIDEAPPLEQIQTERITPTLPEYPPIFPQMESPFTVQPILHQPSQGYTMGFPHQIQASNQNPFSSQ